MYNTIKNPITGRKVNIKSSLGTKILKAYLSTSNVQNGGISFKNRKGDFLHHIGTDEGNNALSSCGACTMMALGLPDEIVNDVSFIHQANLIMARIAKDPRDPGIKIQQFNGVLNEINKSINPNLTSNIYIWGKAAFPHGNVLCVLDKKFIGKRDDPNDQKFGTMYSTQDGGQDLIFLPFSGPPNPDPDPTYGPMIQAALGNIFNNLNNGSSTILWLFYKQGTSELGHVIGISKSYNGNPYLIDAQQQDKPPYQGFWQGEEGIIEYFSKVPAISFFGTFNNSIWVNDGSWNWRLNDIAAELDLDIDAVFPNMERGNPEYLNEAKNSMHPSRMWSYLNQGDIPASAVEEVN